MGRSNEYGKGNILAMEDGLILVGIRIPSPPPPAGSKHKKLLSPTILVRGLINKDHVERKKTAVVPIGSRIHTRKSGHLIALTKKM
jgi:hypothetical protein